MYTNDKKMQKIDGKSFVTFQPNTIMYAVNTESDLGKKIAKSKMGIVFHTTYTGGTIEDLSASFGANISKLGNSSDVWIDDATYKDVSGKGSMTAKETLALTQELSKTGKAFHGIKRKDLTKFMEIQGEILRKGSGASYKTYCNTLIRGGSYKPTYEGYMKHFEGYWEEKVVGKVKQEKTKAIKREIGEQLYNELRSLKKMIQNLTSFMGHLVVAKQLINGWQRTFHALIRLPLPNPNGPYARLLLLLLLCACSRSAEPSEQRLVSCDHVVLVYPL